MTVKFQIVDLDDYRIIHFTLNNNLSPQDLKSIEPPKIVPTKGVVLSGRGPIWLYGFLLHHFHPTKFVAIYDPRLGGAIIVETHDRNHKVGDLVKIDYEVLEKLE